MSDLSYTWKIMASFTVHLDICPDRVKSTGMQEKIMKLNSNGGIDIVTQHHKMNFKLS